MTRGEISSETAEALRSVVVYTSSLVVCSVCAPADMPLDEVEDAVNVLNPTGISSRWSKADRPFSDGLPNPSPCNDDPLKKHWLLSC